MKEEQQVSSEVFVFFVPSTFVRANKIDANNTLNNILLLYILDFNIAGTFFLVIGILALHTVTCECQILQESQKQPAMAVLYYELK